MISSQQKAKLIWQCRRGMLELDLLLNRFLKSHLEQLNEAQVRAFEELLTFSDPEINLWLMGYENPQKQELLDIVALIRLQHHLP